MSSLSSPAPRPRKMLGILDVHVHSGAGLPVLCPFGEQDVYVRFRFGELDPMCDAILQTRTIRKGGSRPMFEQTLQIGVPEGRTHLRCEVFATQARSRDQLLGLVDVGLEGILHDQSNKKQRKPTEYSLCSERTEPCGSLFLTFSFHGRGNGPETQQVQHRPRGGRQQAKAPAAPLLVSHHSLPSSAAGAQAGTTGEGQVPAAACRGEEAGQGATPRPAAHPDPPPGSLAAALAAATAGGAPQSALLGRNLGQEKGGTCPFLQAGPVDVSHRPLLNSGSQLASSQNSASVPSAALEAHVPSALERALARAAGGREGGNSVKGMGSTEHGLDETGPGHHAPTGQAGQVVERAGLLDRLSHGSLRKAVDGERSKPGPSDDLGSRSSAHCGSLQRLLSLACDGEREKTLGSKTLEGQSAPLGNAHCSLHKLIAWGSSTALSALSRMPWGLSGADPGRGMGEDSPIGEEVRDPQEAAHGRLSKSGGTEGEAVSCSREQQQVVDASEYRASPVVYAPRALKCAPVFPGVPAGPSTVVASKPFSCSAFRPYKDQQAYEQDRGREAGAAGQQREAESVAALCALKLGRHCQAGEGKQDGMDTEEGRPRNKAATCLLKGLGLFGKEDKDRNQLDESSLGMECNFAAGSSVAVPSLLHLTPGQGAETAEGEEALLREVERGTATMTLDQESSPMLSQKGEEEEEEDRDMLKKSADLDRSQLALSLNLFPACRGYQKSPETPKMGWGVGQSPRGAGGEALCPLKGAFDSALPQACGGKRRWSLSMSLGEWEDCGRAIGEERVAKVEESLLAKSLAQLVNAKGGRVQPQPKQESKKEESLEGFPVHECPFGQGSSKRACTPEKRGRGFLATGREAVSSSGSAMQCGEHSATKAEDSPCANMSRNDPKSTTASPSHPHKGATVPSQSPASLRSGGKEGSESTGMTKRESALSRAVASALQRQCTPKQRVMQGVSEESEVLSGTGVALPDSSVSCTGSAGMLLSARKQSPFKGRCSAPSACGLEIPESLRGVGKGRGVPASLVGPGTERRRAREQQMSSAQSELSARRSPSSCSLGEGGKISPFPDPAPRGGLFSGASAVDPSFKACLELRQQERQEARQGNGEMGTVPVDPPALGVGGSPLGQASLEQQAAAIWRLSQAMARGGTGEGQGEEGAREGGESGRRVIERFKDEEKGSEGGLLEKEGLRSGEESGSEGKTGGSTEEKGKAMEVDMRHWHESSTRGEPKSLFSSPSVEGAQGSSSAPVLPSEDPSSFFHAILGAQGGRVPGERQSLLPDCSVMKELKKSVLEMEARLKADAVVESPGVSDEESRRQAWKQFWEHLDAKRKENGKNGAGIAYGCRAFF